MIGALDHVYVLGALFSGMAIWSRLSTARYMRLATESGEPGKIAVYRDGLIQSLVMLAITVLVWSASGRPFDLLWSRNPAGGAIGAVGTFGVAFLLLLSAGRLAWAIARPETIRSASEWATIAKFLPQSRKAVLLWWLNVGLMPFAFGLAYAGFACWYLDGIVPDWALLIAALIVWMAGGIGGDAILAYRWFVPGFVLIASFLGTGNLWIAIAAMLAFDVMANAGVYWPSRMVAKD